MSEKSCSALASLYEAFTPEEALLLARKLDLVHTPKHGSWLKLAEPELSVLTRQCLEQRIGPMARGGTSPGNGHRRATGGKRESTGNSVPPMHA